MKIAKKSLSIFLALLMIFSACSAGLTGIVASAAEGDSSYSKQEVADLINAATAGGFTYSSGGDKWEYTADDGKALAAARAIFDYAVNTYREGKDSTSAANSTKGLYDAFDATFSSMYTNATAARQLVKNVLNPDGTTVVSYENRNTKTGVKGSQSETQMYAGDDWTENFPYSSNSSSYPSINTSTITKTVNVQIDLDKYLATFDKIEDIPSTIYTGVTYTYAHTYGTSATVTSTTKGTSGSGCNKKDVWTPTMTTATWNYMTAKPVKVEVKDKTVRKTLLTLEKYFTDELFATTRDDMLAMPVEDIKSLYLTTEMMYANLFTDETLTVKKFSDATLAHFGFAPAKIQQFMDDVDFAYRAAAGKYNIDILNTLIGTEYNVESYAEMSELYAKTGTAYDVVYNMDAEIIEYIVGDGGYSEQYESAMALKETAASYNAVLFDIMTEQKLEETVAAMLATYSEYINVLNKEDIENPSDAEVIGLVQKVEAFDEIIDSYKGYSYFRNYWTTAYESEWATFSTKLDEVYEVRGLKMEFETYYDYFLPLIYTTQIDTLDNEGAIALHADLDTKLADLRASYTEVANKWGYTIADKIFTVAYEGSDYFLQTLVENVKSTGKEAVKTVLIARTEAQLDAVYAYKDTTVVNFENFASIKSTLTYFDYDLYNYVNGGGEGQNKWLSTDYTNKYSMVQTLLDRYHAFSTTDGKAYFNEGFTFADENGVYADRYAGSQFDAEGNQIGYPDDIARDGAEDNYVVTEEKLLDTIVKIDSFITSRDFGALLGFEDADEEGVYVPLKTYVKQMLDEVLFNDKMMNTLVATIYPMVVDLIATELIGAISGLGGDEPTTPRDPNASAAIDVGAMGDELDGSGIADLYIDDDTYNGKQYQNYLSKAFSDLGLMIYPTTFADSLLMANPVNYGVGSPIYEALKAADRDWSKLVCEDDPETTLIDETKTLEFEWGVYDEESFLETLSCVLDPLLPLLQTAICGSSYSESASNAAYAKIDKITYNADLSIFSIPLSVSDVAANGDINLSINPLNLYNDVFVPLFHVLGVQNVPTLSSKASSEQIVKALFGTLLDRVDEILDSPLSTVLEILPNLVYFLSMDSIQEIINKLVITLNIGFVLEIDGSNSGTLASILGAVNIEGLINDMLEFEIELDISDMLDLYDMLGFEISDFNEILDFVIPMLGVEGLELPPIRQQDIIFCSDWSSFPDGSVNLVANKGDLVYWFINYVVSALIPDENGNSLLTALLGSDMDPMLSGVIEKVVGQLTQNQKGGLAAIIELLNPTTYDLKDMEWIEQGKYDYNGIEGADQMSIVYLQYGNDWTKAHSQHLVDNAVAIVDEILAMTGSEAVDHGAELQKLLEGLFTNANITALVEMLGGFGDSPSAVIADIVTQQVGIDINSWFVAFGYLYPAETWAEDAEVIPYGHRTYVNNFGVEGTKNEDGTITWSFGKKALVDGDGYTFVNILAKLLGEASIALEFLFAGEEVSAFNGLLTLNGYETYEKSLGLLLQMLGVENLPTQADFNNDTMGAFTNMLTAVLDWFYALTEAEDMIAQVIELLPNIFYFIESNGLSTFLYNLLMPVLVIVDTVRPLIDVDVNGVLSLLTSEGLNYYAVDFNKILEYVIHGIYMNEDMDFEWYDVDVMNLTFTNILHLADKFFDTNFEASVLNQIGIKGYCSGLKKLDTPVGTVYKSTVDAADTLTILLSAVIDCLGQPAQTEGRTNGDELFAFITEVTGNEDIEKYYAAIIDLIQGVDVEYTSPDWGYMFENKDLFSVELPEHSIVYLGYSNNWTKETADAVYDSLEDIVAMVLDSALEGKSIATLLNGILEDKVYTDEILNTVVELLVNLIAALDVTLRDTVDIVLDTDIATWFSFCTYNEETGKYECTKDWGIDRTRESGKKTKFVNAIKEVLAPANQLLAFLFFGGSYEFFTASKGNSLITINGGEGYAKGLVPILEALGCTMKPADAYYANGRYDVPAAVADIFNALLALVDTVSDAPAEEVFKLLPNIIYFLNADGFKSSVNNLLAPVNGVLEKLTPVVDFNIGALVMDAIGLDISDLTTDTLLAFAGEYGFKMDAKLVNLVKTFYIGKLVEFESANGEAAYRMAYTDKESASDMLTIVLSLVVDLFKQNETLLSDLLGAETYKAIADVLKLEGAKPMQRFDWLYTEYADTDKVFTPVETTEIYTATYNEYWTKDKAQYLADNAEHLIQNVLHMMQLEIDGVKLTDVETLVKKFIYDLYSQENADALLAMVKDLVAKLSELEPYGDLIKTVAMSSLGVDLTAWDNMVLTVKDGDRDSFSAALAQILAPVVPVLEILLTGKNVSLLVDIDGYDAITLYGSEGYAYGIIPLLEALGCKNVLTPDAYKAALAKNPANAISAIINPLFDKIDELAADPVNGVLELLPAVIYFVNSNGLDTAAKNLLNTADTVLECLEPLVGATSVMDLLGLNLAEYNFDYLFGLLVDMAAEKGFAIDVFAGNAINELTTGRVVSYQSKNGETYYTMQYASDRDKADMVTVILRLVIEFLVDDTNYAAIKGLLAEAIADEDTYNSVCTVLDAVIAAAAEDPTRGQAMATVYYLFVTLDKTAEGADNLYHDITNSWAFILHQLETSDDPLMRNLEKSIKESLNKYFDTDYVVGDKESILDEEKDAGTISFFEAIKNFFKKIGDFFRKLFGIKD